LQLLSIKFRPRYSVTPPLKPRFLEAVILDVKVTAGKGPNRSLEVAPYQHIVPSEEWTYHLVTKKMTPPWKRNLLMRLHTGLTLGDSGKFYVTLF
jgi:hypothetical protein